MWKIERIALWLIVSVLAFRLVFAQFAVSPAKWNAALRCTEVAVFGTTNKAYVCDGTMTPPECPTELVTMGPGVCYRSSTGQIVFHDSSGQFSF